MTVFSELETAMDSLAGAGVGGWILGAIVLAGLMLPIGLLLMSRGASASVSSVFVIFIGSASVIINVGVGWWEPWALIFIAIIVIGSWGISKVSGGGGVGG